MPSSFGSEYPVEVLAKCCVISSVNVVTLSFTHGIC